MRNFNFPAAPLLLGFVLGPLMEEHFRQAMLMSRGSFSTFIDSPISATVLAVTAILLVWGTWLAYRRRNQRVLAAQTLSS